MTRFLAWLSLAFLLAGPQGLAGWEHSSLHATSRTAQDHSGAHSEADGEISGGGCWICTSTILGAAEHCNPAIEISLAPPSLDDPVPSCDLFHSSFSPQFSARAPPLS
jgi:hypothetical protein